MPVVAVPLRLLDVRLRVVGAAGVALVAGGVVGAVTGLRAAGERERGDGRERHQSCLPGPHFLPPLAGSMRSVGRRRSGFQSDLGPKTSLRCPLAAPRSSFRSMPGPSGAPYVRRMLRRGGRRSNQTDEDLSWVYGAAIRAASGEEPAARATA